MIITSRIAKNNYDNLSNRDTKLSRDVRDGKLTKIINGLYETNPNTSSYLLASSIYGPSYISFEYALSVYGLIPERVNVVTCATYNKKKSKKYDTPFGTYTYRDIPPLAYPEEVLLKQEGDYSYQIASREKAVCDKLYTLSPLKNYTNLKIMLFSDLRFDEEEFYKLDVDKIEKLSELYHSTNIKLLATYLRRDKHE